VSSLVFFTDKENVIVATDTLAVDDDGLPFMFNSKAIYIPHLRTIIVGTGSGGFSHKWAYKVNCWMITKGIENLNHHTPEALQKLWKEYKTENNISAEQTTTVYHFGISEQNNKVVSFAYSSYNNFKPKKLNYGINMKPNIDISSDNIEDDPFDIIPSIMKQQRALQNKIDKNKRIFIGGEIYYFHLNKVRCLCSKLDEFEDKDIHEKEIYLNFNKNK
jgi:hypothetical protein